MTHIFLDAKDDGLAMRESHDYARDKLTILNGYVNRFTTSMKKQGWTALNYIDLEAGPGKNKILPNDVLLGSPLIAITSRFPFSNYFFVEKNRQNFSALKKRVEKSPLLERVHLYNLDCNVAVDEISREISALDRDKSEGRGTSLNLAFVDPEGLEVRWKTIEKLGRQNRMDLIVNVSTSGITRNAESMANESKDTILDEFFGTKSWRSRFLKVQERDSTTKRRAVLDFYVERLNYLGYVNNRQRELISEERVFKNQRNVQVYSLIFASKHKLGIDFWNSAVKEVRQPRLL